MSENKTIEQQAEVLSRPEETGVPANDLADDAPRDIFISYSRKDYATVRKTYERLVAAGYTCWMDLDLVYNGEEFSGKIAKAIREAKVFMFFASRNSFESEWTRKEVSHAADNNKNFMIIKLDDETAPDSMALHLTGKSLTWMRRLEQFESGIQDILTSLQKQGIGHPYGSAADDATAPLRQTLPAVSSIYAEDISRAIHRQVYISIVTPRWGFLRDKRHDYEPVELNPTGDRLLAFDTKEKPGENLCCIWLNKLEKGVRVEMTEQRMDDDRARKCRGLKDVFGDRYNGSRIVISAMVDQWAFDELMLKYPGLSARNFVRMDEWGQRYFFFAEVYWIGNTIRFLKSIKEHITEPNKALEDAGLYRVEVEEERPERKSLFSRLFGKIKSGNEQS